MNDVSFDRPTNFSTPANPDGITFDEFDIVNPINFQPGVLANIATAPFLPDNMSDVSQWAVFGEAQFNLSDRFAIVGALRMDDYDTQIVRLGRAGIDQQVDDLTGRVGFVFDLSDDTALYGQYGTGCDPSEQLDRDRGRQQSLRGHDRERAARDRPQASGGRDGLRSGTSRCSTSRRTT